MLHTILVGCVLRILPSESDYQNAVLRLNFRRQRSIMHLRFETETDKTAATKFGFMTNEGGLPNPHKLGYFRQSATSTPTHTPNRVPT